MNIRNLIICIALLLNTTSLFSQSEKTISFDLGSCYYAPIDGWNSLFSYGFSFHATQKINKLSVSTGIEYSSIGREDILTMGSSHSHLTSRKHEVKYLDFPVLFLFPNKEIKTVNVKALLGVVLSKQLDYSLTSYYDNSDPIISKMDETGNYFGMSIRAGMELSHHISEDWHIGLAPYVDAMFSAIYGDKHPKSTSIQPINRALVFGVNLSVGYLAF